MYTYKKEVNQNNKIQNKKLTEQTDQKQYN